MAVYRIASPTNVPMGEYEADTAAEAWCMMARDAGYDVYVDDCGGIVVLPGDAEVLGPFDAWNITEVI